MSQATSHSSYNKLVFEIGFVSKSIPKHSSNKAKVDHKAKRSFYECSAEYNVFSYILQDKKTQVNRDIREYMTRNSREEDAKVTGLFNAKGEISAQKFEEIRKELSKTGSNIWHGFLSFDTETSKGFNSTEDGIRFLRQSFDSFLSKTHLKKDNLELFATLHKDTEHKHIHFCFYEKEPKTVNKHGKVGYTHKGVIWENTITNYRVNANMYLHDSKEYYTARDRVIEKLKEFRAKGARQHSSEEVKSELMQVAQALPKVGKCSYGVLQKSDLHKVTLARVDKLIPMLFAQNDQAFGIYKELKEQLKKRQNIFEEVLKSNANGDKVDKKSLQYMDKLRQDLQVRLGNQVIAIAKSMGTDYMRMRRDFVNKASCDRHLKIRAKRQRSIAERVWNSSKKKLKNNIERLHQDFSNEMRRIESDIARDIRQGEMAMRESAG